MNNQLMESQNEISRKLDSLKEASQDKGTVHQLTFS